ncbi:MAG: hypothetical protein KKA62_03510 [Nanoarchaeota archaeon]|nr:hypothetical protein [Nanoarchaeota archaeon]MBU1976993.1 hypothetical protein [Nanoarchaeota archaeon]
MRSLDSIVRGPQPLIAIEYHPHEIAAGLYLLDRIDDKKFAEAVQKSKVRGLKQIFEEEMKKYRSR